MASASDRVMGPSYHTLSDSVSKMPPSLTGNTNVRGFGAKARMKHVY